MTASSPDAIRTIKVKAETAQLAQIRSFVEEIAAQAALNVERVFDLKVAVSEACANSMEHAGCRGEWLEICSDLQAERLTFIITDSGSFLAPSPARDPVSNRGFGLPLMVALMDEVRFARTAGGGTKVTLSVLLDRARTQD